MKGGGALHWNKLVQHLKFLFVEIVEKIVFPRNVTGMLWYIIFVGGEDYFVLF